MADADGASKLSECFEKLERAYLALPTSRDDYGTLLLCVFVINFADVVDD